MVDEVLFLHNKFEPIHLSYCAELLFPIKLT